MQIDKAQKHTHWERLVRRALVDSRSGFVDRVALQIVAGFGIPPAIRADCDPSRPAARVDLARRLMGT